MLGLLWDSRLLRIAYPSWSGSNSWVRETFEVLGLWEPVKRIDLLMRGFELHQVGKRMLERLALKRNRPSNPIMLG